jgi:integrase
VTRSRSGSTSASAARSSAATGDRTHRPRCAATAATSTGTCSTTSARAGYTELTADDFQLLVERLTGLGLSGSKVRNVLVPCQAFYRRHRREVLADPTAGLDLPEPGGRRERAATLTEAAVLLDPLGDDRPVWATAFYAGLRRGELRALRVSNLRGLDGDTVASIRVEHGWDDVEGERDTKSVAGVREVPMPKTLRAILAENLARTGRRGDDFVFGLSARQPFAPSQIRRRAEKACAVAAVGAFLRRERPMVELDPITLHECRHSCWSYLDAAGISESRSDRYMGHSNRSVAARGRHQLDGQLVEDAARLEEYLSGALAGKVVALAKAAA